MSPARCRRLMSNLVWFAELSVRPDLIHQLVPPHAEQALYKMEGIQLDSFQPVDLSQMRVQVD